MTEKSLNSTRRMPKDSIDLKFAGDLVLPQTSRKDLGGFFHRYQLLFEYFANMPAYQRAINYKILNGLILTSHAKKTQDISKKKIIFDLKNKIFLNLANDREARKMLVFKYLSSKNFRVTKFCDTCAEENSQSQQPKHERKFCAKCQINRNFYNVLSMYHRNAKGHC